jgi:diadenosine tetraphosphate (Ap4A) HIT family hydrolase
VLLNDADYPAYCRVELLSHIKEMTDLVPMERSRMMKTVFAVELALREMLNPDKINLASLGNKTPHLHWHVIPRFAHDKHFPNSHWGEIMRESAATRLDDKVIQVLSEKVKAHVECALNTD